MAEKSMNDAEYSSKLDKANKLQKVIKKKLKGKEAGLSDAAKEFVKVNPSNVADIDNYLEKAEAVSKGLQPTRKPSKGDLKVTKPFDIKKITEYSKKEVEAEAIRNYELAKESFQEITGLEAGDLTLEQLREALNEVEGEKKTAEFEKEKKKTIDKAVENAFKNTKINIKGAIESGDIKITKEQKTLINNFLNMDLNLMTTKQKMEALDSIVNFELNQSTGGMEAVLKKQKGVKELTYIENKGFKTPKNPKLWGLGPKWNKYISTLPNLFELSFKSQQKGRMVMNALGLNGIINGSAKAQTQSAQVEKDYANAFAKKKMQDGIYFDESNDTERAILAEARRYTPGTEAEQQKEFDDSKNLIKETYERLMASGDKLKVKKGEIVKKQYEKLLKDSKTIAEVESKADPVNLQGVEYVTDIWSEKYNELADVSLNIYNRNLGKDVNYTPRNIRSEPLTGRISPPSGATFEGLLTGSETDRFLLASDAGYGFVVQFGQLQAKNKAGKALLSLPQGARVLPPAAVTGDAEPFVVVATNEGRMLVFPLSELPEMSRGKGNKLIGIPSARSASREEFVAGLCVLAEGDMLQVTSGGHYRNFKWSELEHFRGDRGRRGSKLPKGYQRVTRLTVVE